MDDMSVLGKSARTKTQEKGDRKKGTDLFMTQHSQPKNKSAPFP